MADRWRRHADEGARIIARLGFLSEAIPAIRHHHERYDGSGYPDGLGGEDIPLGARVIHLADALDSMVSPRVPAGAADRRCDGGAEQQLRDAVLPAVCRGPRGRGCGRRGVGSDSRGPGLV